MIVNNGIKERERIKKVRGKKDLMEIKMKMMIMMKILIVMMNIIIVKKRRDKKIKKKEKDKQNGGGSIGWSRIRNKMFKMVRKIIIINRITRKNKIIKNGKGKSEKNKKRKRYKVT